MAQQNDFTSLEKMMYDCALQNEWKNEGINEQK